MVEPTFHQQPTGHDTGFTLIELIAVIAILGILALIAISSVSPRAEPMAAEDALRAHLRFAQARAMSEDPQGSWGIQLNASSYTLLDNGASATSTIFPGTDSATYALPAGVSISGGSGALSFDFRGSPSLNGTPLTANHIVTFSSGRGVTITKGTGYVQ